MCVVVCWCSGGSGGDGGCKWGTGSGGYNLLKVTVLIMVAVTVCS